MSELRSYGATERRNLLKDGHKIGIGQLTSCAILMTNYYDGATIKVEDEAKRLTIEVANQRPLSGRRNDISKYRVWSGKR